MKLYIGNATSQNFDFHYRLPENPRVLNRFIPMGEQVLITGDLSTPEIEAVVKQGATYGMISVDEVDRRSSLYRGLCYSIGKPISSSKIEKLFHANTGVLIDLGRELRKNAAIVENNRMLRQAREHELVLKEMEMSVQEENGEMAEGFRANFGESGSTTPRRGRRKAQS